MTRERAEQLAEEAIGGSAGGFGEEYLRACFRVADAILRASEETREECAKEMDERAENLRLRAEQTRREWCGQDIDPEDRRDNAADARNDYEMARVYGRAAAAIRARGGEGE